MHASQLLENTPQYINSYAQTNHHAWPKQAFSFDTNSEGEVHFFQEHTAESQETPILFYENLNKAFLLCAEAKEQQSFVYTIKELDIIGNVYENDIAYDLLDTIVCPVSSFEEAVSYYLQFLKGDTGNGYLH